LLAGRKSGEKGSGVVRKDSLAKQKENSVQIGRDEDLFGACSAKVFLIIRGHLRVEKAADEGRDRR